MRKIFGLIVAGAKVDLQDVQNGPKAVEAMVGGSADMVYGAIGYVFLP